ncbi:BnaC02g26280D [Brassica napus]|uniref:(rape) hypothetical protein n=1 Tax=Brassica napus TaxID=3708 RepID=A0A078H9N4_BRANA|nr:unnamed protein product [Brassica napus]CDY33528.1 BnaC02g26280D [Brassica napus]
MGDLPSSSHAAELEGYTTKTRKNHRSEIWSVTGAELSEKRSRTAAATGTDRSDF